MQISLGAFYKKKRENNLTDELREDEKRKQMTDKNDFFFCLLRDLPEAGPCMANKITEIYVKALQPWWNGTLPQARRKLSSALHLCFENTSLSDRDNFPKVDYFA